MPDIPGDQSTPIPQDGSSSPPAPTQETPPAPPASQEEPPDDKGPRRPWKGAEDFDAEKAARLLDNLQADLEKAKNRNKELEPLAQQARELEESKKSDLQRLTESRDELQSNLTKTSTELAQLRAALKAAPDGAPLATVLMLADRLRGSDEEELLKDAQELYEKFLPAGTAGSPPPPTGRRPKENLQPGAVPQAESTGPTSPTELAKLIPR